MREVPVLVLAYANDRFVDARYLRDLPEEQRRVRAALRRPQEQGRCEVVECYNATVADVIAECQSSGARLTVFHFAGHADGKSLAFESPDGSVVAVGADAVAQFLGGLDGLRLVVLNGCSTKNQVRALLDAGVDAVVATSTAVRDDVAREFAHNLYQGLAGSASIAKAFEQASGATRMQFAPTGDEREAIRSLTRDVVPAAEPDQPAATNAPLASLGWPWEKFGSEAALSAVLFPRVAAAPELPSPPRWVIGAALLVAASALLIVYTLYHHL
jgi:CHAT domain-containing protein